MNGIKKTERMKMTKTNSFVGIDPGNGGGIAVLTDSEDDSVEIITRKLKIGNILFCPLMMT